MGYSNAETAENAEKRHVGSSLPASSPRSLRFVCCPLSFLPESQLYGEEGVAEGTPAP